MTPLLVAVHLLKGDVLYSSVEPLLVEEWAWEELQHTIRL